MLAAALLAVLAALLPAAMPVAAATSTSTLASVSDAGVPAVGPHETPAISADGTRVAFVSAAPLAKGGGLGVQDVYLRDVRGGRTVLVSRHRPCELQPCPVSGDSWAPAISADGLTVAFVSDASDLAATHGDTGEDVGDSNPQPDLYVVRFDDAFRMQRLSLESLDVEGQALGAEVGPPAVSHDGTTVAFATTASLLGDDADRSADVYVRRLATRAAPPAPALVRLASACRGSAAECAGEVATAADPALDAGGERVAFTTTSPLTAASDANGRFADVVVVDLAASSATIASLGTSGRQVPADALEPSLDAAGTRVAFTTIAALDAAADRNGLADVYVRDLAAGRTLLASRTRAGAGAGASRHPSLDAAGGRVAFTTWSHDLAAGSRCQLAFGSDCGAVVADLDTARIQTVPTRERGETATLGATSLSGDGTTVAFTSASVALGTADGASGRQVRLHTLDAPPSPALRPFLSASDEDKGEEAPVPPAPPAQPAPPADPAPPAARAQSIGSIQVTPPSQDFGDVVVFTTETVTATASNPGDSNVTITNITAASPFAASNACDGAVLPPGGTCNFQLSFTPTTTGPATGQADVNYVPDGGSPTATGVPLQGRGVDAAAPLTADPPAVDFGQVYVGGTSPPVPVTLTNSATSDVVDISSFTLEGAAPQDFALDPADCVQREPLVPSESCQLAIRAAPTAQGVREAVAVIVYTTTSDATPQRLEVPLRVEGLPLPPPRTGITEIGSLGPTPSPGPGKVTRLGNTSGQQTTTPAQEPSLDDLGQLLVFTTLDSLAPSDTNNTIDVYLRNRVTGETTHVSRRRLGPTGCEDFSNTPVPCVGGDAVQPAISNDGAFVAFTGFSDDITAVYGPEGDTSGNQVGQPRDDTDDDTSGKVFVWERATGLIRVASLDADGAVVSCLDDSSDPVGASDPAISATGRFVAFTTFCSPEADVDDDTFEIVDVYRRDMGSGAHNLALVSLRCTSCSATSGDAVDPAISGDGNQVVFASTGEDFVLPCCEVDDNNVSDIYFRDFTEPVVRLLTQRGGTQANGASVDPDISGDGGRVTFATTATNLFGPPSCATTPTGVGCDAGAGGNGGIADIALLDRGTGIFTRVSRDDAGNAGNFHSTDGRISTDGRYVAFLSGATNLVPDDTNNTITCPPIGIGPPLPCTTDNFDVFSHDSIAGRTFRVNVASDGSQADSGSECDEPGDRPEACAPSINRDGRHVAFTSEATNLETPPPPAPDPVRDVFVHYAVLTVQPPTLPFGDVAVGATSGPGILIVLNGSSGPVRVGSVLLSGPHAADYTIVTDGCTGVVLYPDGSCTITLTFTPSVAGSRTARVTVNDDPLELSTTPPNPPFSDLSGNGTTGGGVCCVVPPDTPDRRLAVAPVLDFGKVRVLRSRELPLVVSNIGTDPVDIGAASIGGADAGDFTIVSNDCGPTLAPGTSCTIVIRFRPTVQAPRAATLTIPSNANPALPPVSLIGRGVLPLLVFSPSPKVFPTTSVGASVGPSVVTVTNIGDGDVDITGVSIGGLHPGDFEVVSTNCVQTLTGGEPPVPGESCFVSVRFRPTSVTPEQREADLVLTSDADDSPHTSPLRGRARRSSLVLEPGSANFGTLPIDGADASVAFLARNVGTVSVTPTSVFIDGHPDFSLVSNACGGSLPPLAACGIVVVFDPSGPGLRAATLVVQSTAADSPATAPLIGRGLELPSPSPSPSDSSTIPPTLDIPPTPATPPPTGGPGDGGDGGGPGGGGPGGGGPGGGVPGGGGTDVSGTGGIGVDARLEVSPNPPVFGLGVIGVTQLPRVLTATSIGTSPLTITNVRIAGRDLTDFTLTDDTCTGRILAPRASCSISVLWRPTVANDRTALAVFTHTGSNNPVDVPLIGRGLEPRLRTDRPLAARGTVINVLGDGFPPNEALVLGWDRGLGELRVVADAGGSFRVPMLVFKRDFLGPRQLQARAATYIVSTGFLVVPSTVAPPFLGETGA